jgi:hypothetical protein
MPSSRLVFWCLLSFCLGSAAAAETTGTLIAGPAVDHRQKFGGRAEVELRMDRGSLTVRAGGTGEVRLRGRLGAEVEGVEVKHEGNWLRFEVQPQDAPPGTPQQLDSELELELPAGSDLVVEAPAAAIAISGEIGKVDLRTLSGTVRLAGKAAAAEVQTISGGITTTGEFVCPLTVLRSVAGLLELDGRFEELNARTADSLLRMKGKVSDEAKLESGQGEVRFEGELGPASRLIVNTLGGPARLLLPPDLEGHFQVSSFEGELDNRLGPGFDRKGLRRHKEWRRGEAPRRIEVETFYGKISLLPAGTDLQ